MPSSLYEQYSKDGFVIVPDLIDSKDLPALDTATERAIAKTRARHWPYARVVGKQFPPFGEGDDFWGVQHLMHPDLDEPAFVKWYGSSRLLAAVVELLDCRKDELQMELFNLLINPAKSSFALRWHRDDVREMAEEDEELRALGIRHYGLQWNTALKDDSSLWVVPGSHRQPRTLAQRGLSMTHVPPKDPSEMPGALQVHLSRGETVFYNNNILHTATYSPTISRATLHACIGDTRGGSIRARNILQHGLSWMRTDEFAKSVASNEPELTPMLERLVYMADGVKDDLGYSLEG